MSVESDMLAASGGNNSGFSGDEFPLRRMGDRFDENIASGSFALTTALGKRSYRKIAGLRNSTGIRPREELGLESKVTATAPG
jgi:hypothetical protein